MARTYEANVILGLKDQLSKGAKDAAKSVDLLAKSFDHAEKQAKEFATSVGNMPKWGSSFQKQIDRMRLAPAEIAKLKASFASLNREMGEGTNKAFRTTATNRWKNQVIANILEVREAERQLTADAIREEKARAAAAIRLAAQTAREKARLAQETARAQAEAARKASKAEQAAARESAKVAKEVAQAAHKEARRLELEARRAQRIQERQDASSRRRLVGFTSDTVRNIGYAAGLGGGTYLAGRGVAATGREGAEVHRERARDYLGGMSSEDSARIEAKAYATSARYKAVDANTMHSLIRESSLTQMGVDGAMGIAPDLAKAFTVISSMKSPEQALASLTRFVRGLDTLGKNVDPEQVRALLDGVVRAQGVEGMEFDPGDIFTMAKRSKSGGFSLNNRFLSRIVPALVSDMGPDRVGTALGSGVSQVIGGRATKASIAEQQAMGMRDKKGNFLNQKDFLSDPFKYATDTLVPLLQSKGIDADNEMAVAAIMSKLFSNQMVADLFGRMVVQREAYLGKERQGDKAPGTEAADSLTERDPFVAFAGAMAQVRNAIGALSDPIIPTFVSALNRVGNALSNVTGWLRDNGLAGTAGVAGGAAGMGLAGLGAYKAYQGITGGFGLAASAVALDGSAAALTAAAARLGGTGGPNLPGSGAASAAAGGSAVAAGAVVGGVVAGGAGLSYGSANVASMPGAAAVSENPMLSALSGDFGFGAAIIAAADNASPAAQQAGGGIGSDIAAGIRASSAQAEQASMGIFERIKAIFAGGVDVPVRPSMAYPGVGLNRAGANGGGGLGMDTAGRATGPGRASGGNVYAGGLYQVNEFGQEFFSPAQNGTVHPAGSGGGRGPVGPITFHITGSNAEAIADRVSSELSGVFADYGLDFD